MNFKDFDDNQKPREKALKYGIETLRDYELLAILLRTGTKEKNVLKLANDMIFELGGLEKLTNVNFSYLKKIKGIGNTKALEIIAAIELGKRFKINVSKTIEKIVWPNDVIKIVKNYFLHLSQEHFCLLLLNNQNKLLHQTVLYKGTKDSINVDIKDLLYLIITYRASKIICVHNHPSGDSEPSIADLKVTKKIKQQLEVFDVILIDHIVIGANNYYSINLGKKYYFSYEI